MKTRIEHIVSYYLTMSMNIKGVFLKTYYPAKRVNNRLKTSSGGSTETKLDSKKSSDNHLIFKVKTKKEEKS
jgi:hypothetical protein